LLHNILIGIAMIPFAIADHVRHTEWDQHPAEKLSAMYPLAGLPVLRSPAEDWM
jgi:hypothetical protein